MDDMLRKELREIRGLRDQFENMLLNEEDGERNRIEAKKFLSGRECWVKGKKNKNPYLAKISDGNTITIRATDGKKFISASKDIFKSVIDSDFNKYELDVPSPQTKEMNVEIFETIKDGTLKNLFRGFGENLDRLVLTQEQVGVFCKEYLDYLRKDRSGTFFLLKGKEEYFVAGVYVYFDGLAVSVCRLSCDGVWHAGCRSIVVPQL
jgi:hypothetical protein